MNSIEIKNVVLRHGADICGIAPVNRFTDAPKGFHPVDIFDKCRSVIVYAKAMPSGSNTAQNCIPYTYMNQMITQEVDKLTFKLCIEFEKSGMHVVPIPSDDPYEYWLEEEQCGRAILSLRHAGYLAGLGVLGKNTLLMNDRFGNMIQLGAVLSDAILDGDPLADYEGCLNDCTICLEECPLNALDGKAVNQKLCRSLSNFRHEKGYVLKKCNTCRTSCPFCTGIN
ncbi:MAG: epoxyqueuosine reductase [Calditrichaceae bacterium]|nr:epoxyqueuosine reductase [Calditrichaceae bacterium]